MSGPHQFRKKPVVIEAMKLTERNLRAAAEWADAVVTDPCKADIFDATYEAVT